jgi:hypothetical protein
MTTARRSVARTRSLLACGNAVPNDAFAGSWADQLGEQTCQRILAGPGEPDSSTGPACGRPEPGLTQPLSAPRAVALKRWLIPGAASAAAAVAVIAAAALVAAARGGPTPSGNAGGAAHGSIPARVRGTVFTGSHPFGIATDHRTGLLYVTNIFGQGTAHGTVSVINAAHGTVTGTITVDNSSISALWPLMNRPGGPAAPGPPAQDKVSPARSPPPRRLTQSAGNHQRGSRMS